MKLIALYLLLLVGAFAQSTKVGGSGTTKVGGSGTTKVSAYVAAAGIVVQNNWKNVSSSGTTCNVTVTGTSGRRIAALFITDGATVTISDNQSTSYTATPTNTGFGSLVGAAISAPIGSGVTTVTATASGSGYMQVFVYEVSGLASGYTTGEYATNFFVGDPTWDSSTVTTATANSVIFYIAGANNGSETTTFGTYTNSFASFGSNAFYGLGSSGFATVTSYRVVSSTGGYSTSVTPSTSGNGINIIVALN